VSNHTDGVDAQENSCSIVVFTQSVVERAHFFSADLVELFLVFLGALCCAFVDVLLPVDRLTFESLPFDVAVALAVVLFGGTSFFNAFLALTLPFAFAFGLTVLSG
jgi:hypothetical protein